MDEQRWLMFIYLVELILPVLAVLTLLAWWDDRRRKSINSGEFETRIRKAKRVTEDTRNV